jgi:hypothetical protein
MGLYAASIVLTLVIMAVYWQASRKERQSDADVTEQRYQL